MDSKLKNVLLETQDGIKVRNVEAPVTRDGRDDQLPKSEHFPSVRVKTEVVVDTEIKDGRSSDSQREIEMLRGALKQRDEELRAVTRLFLNQLYPGDVSKRGKLDESAEPSEKRVKFGDNHEGKGAHLCSRCKTRHLGRCSSKTRRCGRCGRVGHIVAGCENPLLCFNCGGAGHISKECPKKNMKIGQICYSCRSAGHHCRDCPKKKSG